MKQSMSALVSGVLCMAALAAAADTVQLVAPGQSGVIVVPGRPVAEVSIAARELSQYVGKITGRELPVIAEGVGVFRKVRGRTRLKLFSRGEARPTGKPEIHVGWTAKALKTVDKARVDKLDMDGHLIKITPDAISLVGPKPWSTAYACFTFLEEFCGVRWYMPGEIGEHVPRSASLAFAVTEKTYEPAYGHRQYSGFQWRNRPELKRWGMHQKVRARLLYHHNLWRVFPSSKYGKKYPDVYPILGGRRRVPGASVKSGWQPCLTHPKAVELTMEYARESFKKNPDLASISLGINDGGRYCECPRCITTVRL